MKAGAKVTQSKGGQPKGEAKAGGVRLGVDAGAAKPSGADGGAKGGGVKTIDKSIKKVDHQRAAGERTHCPSPASCGHKRSRLTPLRDRAT